MIGNGTMTCHFLTPGGWIEYDDPTAIYDQETWPAGAVLAGLLVTTTYPGLAGPRTRWRPHWRDPEATPETWQALADRFGLSPMPAEAVA